MEYKNEVLSKFSCIIYAVACAIVILLSIILTLSDPTDPLVIENK